MFSPLSIQHLTFDTQHSPSEQLPLEGPPLGRHASPLHQHADVFSNSIRQNEPPGVLALLAEEKWIVGCHFVQRSKQFVIGRSRGEKELRLPIEKERRESSPFAGPLEIGEIDMCRQILTSGIDEKIARNTMSGICGCGSEMSRAAGEKFALRISVIKGDDQATADEAADLIVCRFPIKGNIGELTVTKLDSALSEVIRISRLRFVLAPIKSPVALCNPQLMKLIAAPDQPCKRQGIEKLVADDQLRIAAIDSR